MKKCFTINCMRTANDFIGYNFLLQNNIFQGVELFYPYNVQEEQNVLYTNEVKKLLDNNASTFRVLHLPHGTNNDLVTKDLEINTNVLNRFFDAITYASKFDVKRLTLHLGNSFKNDLVSRDSLLKVIEIVLKQLCEKASVYDMDIMIENMPSDSELGYSPNEILQIIRNVNMKNLKFILDTGHAHVSIYEIVDYIYTLKDYLCHIHFSDNNSLRDEHKPIHEGTINFTPVFNALKDINYDKLHCLEILFKDYKDLINYSNTIDEYDY